MIREYNKIVRTKIPQIIRANGSEPKIRDDKNMFKDVAKLFKLKILEEAYELREAKSTDEILDEAADVIQVVIDYVRTIGHSVEDLEIARLAKEVKRGSFLRDDGLPVYLIHVDNPE